MERKYHGIARIKAADGRVVGAGFLIAKGLVMTCAHNVTAAMRFGDLDYPGYPDPPSLAHEAGRLLVDFPLAISEEDFGVVKIAAWYAPVDPGKSKTKLADVAILELKDTPEGVSPVEFAREESYARCSFKAYGVPAGLEFGTWAYGEIAESVGAGLCEMHKVGKAGEQRDWFVEEGYSGSAAWSGKPDAVAGMIVFALGKKRAYMISAERLKPLRAAAIRTRASSEDESIDLICCIDREGPLQHLKTIPWQPARRLLTLVIDGDRQQLPYVFVDRIKREGQLARFWRGEAPEFVSIAWPGETHLTNPREQLKHLVAIAAATVEAKGQSSEDIRAAINQGKVPLAFYSILREGAFGEGHLQLLVDWLHFWYEVAPDDSPAGPRLARPVGIVICCEYKATAKAEVPTGPFFKRLFASVHRRTVRDMRHQVRKELLVDLAPPHPEYLPELTSVPVPWVVEEWLNEKVYRLRPSLRDRIEPARMKAYEVYNDYDELPMQEVVARASRLGIFNP